MIVQVQDHRQKDPHLEIPGFDQKVADRSSSSWVKQVSVDRSVSPFCDRRSAEPDNEENPIRSPSLQLPDL